MALVTLSSISRRANGRWLLWDVSLSMDHGEIMGVFGRSGSGKTSLARVITGLDTPSGGSVTLDRDAHVSLAMSTPAFAPELTVYENLEMFAALSGVPRKQRARQISYLIELLALAEHRALRASLVSSGAAARLEIARALAMDAPLTIFDSVIDSLDPPMREKLWSHLLELRRKERKSFLVLTSVAKVAELCSRITVMHRGGISFTGRPDDFRRLAGEDVVVLGELRNPMLRNRIAERISVVVQEQDGFLSFRVDDGERTVSDLLAEFGSDLGCVYLKRPTLDDALDVLSDSSPCVAARVGDR